MLLVQLVLPVGGPERLVATSCFWNVAANTARFSGVREVRLVEAQAQRHRREPGGWVLGTVDNGATSPLEPQLPEEVLRPRAASAQVGGHSSRRSSSGRLQVGVRFRQPAAGILEGAVGMQVVVQRACSACRRPGRCPRSTVTGRP